MKNTIPDLQPGTLDMARNIGLSTEEYQHICRKLERTPTFAELGVFSAMYSEHCSYKSSRPHLRRFPTKGKRVVQGPGENAGVLDIGQGHSVVFKMESHNHPSFIEPYQGAATGVGGILRDVFTMGARPIASMNGLCFGSIDHAKTPSLVKGVVKGIGDYGNSVGVPTVAGQTFFHPSYSKNILVNAFTMGIIKTNEIHKGKAEGVGNKLVYVGAKTGRDGVHGATMASKEFSSEKELERPTVQVGDPFTEKLLLEASIEVMKAGLVVGIQDMGAAGITSSSFEMAHRAGTGLFIDLDRIPTREANMSAYELLLSESQERMLLVAKIENLAALQAVFEKWDLHAEVIGEVIAGNFIRMKKNDEEVVHLPTELVVDAPLPERPLSVPSDLKQRWFYDRNRMLSATLEAKFDAVVSDPNFADPAVLVEQYDSMVGNRTIGGTFEDSATLRVRDIEGTNLKLMLSTDCNPRICWLNPREGGRRAVAEAALNVAIRGAEPIGITDCLNFGSPENPEVMWQFSEAIDGITETCEALNIPVISGNVSFYNDTDGNPILPTPMIGLVGLSEGKKPEIYSAFQSTDVELALLGSVDGGIGGSVLAYQWFKRDCGKPEDTDLPALQRMLKFFKRMNDKKNPYTVHDISDGGLVTAVLEMVFRAKHIETGVALAIPREADVDAFLFGESVPRVLIAYDNFLRTEIEAMASQAGVVFTAIGHTTDDKKFLIQQGGRQVLSRDISGLKQAWRGRWNSLFE